MFGRNALDRFWYEGQSEGVLDLTWPGPRSPSIKGYNLICGWSCLLTHKGHGQIFEAHLNFLQNMFLNVFG